MRSTISENTDHRLPCEHRLFCSCASDTVAQAIGGGQRGFEFSQSVIAHVWNSRTKVEPSVVHITQLNKVSQVQRDFFGFPVAVGPERLQADLDLDLGSLFPLTGTL